LKPKLVNCSSKIPASFCNPASRFDLAGDIFTISLFLFHRALAACKALACRSSAVIVTKRRLPPILPPLRPIADITREISAWLVARALIGRSDAVERSTIRKAAWFSSEGLLLIRFGMNQVFHNSALFPSSK
jgi:hypothetical protein